MYDSLSEYPEKETSYAFEPYLEISFFQASKFKQMSWLSYKGTIKTDYKGFLCSIVHKWYWYKIWMLDRNMAQKSENKMMTDRNYIES